MPSCGGQAIASIPQLWGSGDPRSCGMVASAEQLYPRPMSETLGTAGMVARDGIAALCASGLGTLELLGEVARRVATVMPYDSGAWMSLDPVTLLPTSSHLVGTDTARATASLHRRFGENEVFVPDFLKLRDLARAQLSVGSLLQATGRKITRSARQREINAPLGIVDEIRSVFRSNGTAWGAASLGRFEGRPPYSSAELGFLTGIGEHIANGLRLALLREAPTADDEHPAVPGLLVLDEHEQIASLTPEAQLWIAQIPADGNADADLPAAIYFIARQARALASNEYEGLRSAQARIRLRDGSWLLVRGTTLLSPHGGPRQSAVFLEPASAAQLAPLLVAVHELSAREREVTEQLLHGLTIEEIATKLFISRHTVRDHTKAIFGKFDVRSRPELTAKLAADRPPPNPGEGES